MKQWQRRAIGILTIGGGFTGMTVLGMMVMKADMWPNRIIGLVAIALYIWGIWCGAMLYEGHDNWLNANRLFWALQIPYFMSPKFGYALSCGAEVIVTIGYKEPNINFQWFAYLGSRTEWNYHDAKQTTCIGINFFALLVVIFLSRCLKEYRQRIAAPVIQQSSIEALP